jgi:hypothetical protein
VPLPNANSRIQMTENHEEGELLFTKMSVAPVV